MPDPEIPPRPHQPTPSTEAKPEASEDLTFLVVCRRKFNLGRMVITSAAQAVLSEEDVLTAFTRHSRCDWGNVCADDAKVNERGVREQDMILSSYQSATGVTFWVITDPGHEVTTVLLPDDY